MVHRTYLWGPLITRHALCCSSSTRSWPERHRRNGDSRWGLSETFIIAVHHSRRDHGVVCARTSRIDCPVSAETRWSWSPCIPRSRMTMDEKSDFATVLIINLMYAMSLTEKQDARDDAFGSLIFDAPKRRAAERSSTTSGDIGRNALFSSTS